MSGNLHLTPAFARRTVLGFIAASAALPACAQMVPDVVRPEDFGAAGDGRRDDSRALATALTAASNGGVPLELGAGRIYAVGGRGWPGMRTVPGRGIIINGNGATLRLHAAPQQGLPVGNGKALIRVDGGTARIDGLNVDLGGQEAAAIALDRCQLEISGCNFSNGAAGSIKSYGLFATRCEGTIADNGGSRLGHLFYIGHTDRGTHSSRLRITGNHGRDLVGDFIVGVVKDSLIQSNTCVGMFGGVVLSAYDREGSFCDNVTIVGNSFSNFRAHGVQTDVIGGVVDRRLTIADNVMTGGGAGAAGIYLVRIDGFEVTGNRMEAVDYGIVLDIARNGSITQNVITAGGRHRTRAIGLVAALGDIMAIRILANQAVGFEDGIILEGQRGRVSDIEISQNSFTNGMRGIRATAGFNDVVVRNNIARGNSAVDVDIRGNRPGQQQ